MHRAVCQRCLFLFQYYTVNHNHCVHSMCMSQLYTILDDYKSKISVYRVKEYLTLACLQIQPE